MCVWWCAHLSSLIPTSGSGKDWITSFSKLNCRLLNSRNNNHQVVNLTVWKRKSMAWKLGSKCSHMTTLFSVVRKLILAFYFPKQLLCSCLGCQSEGQFLTGLHRLMSFLVCPSNKMQSSSRPTFGHHQTARSKKVLSRSQ